VGLFAFLLFLLSIQFRKGPTPPSPKTGREKIAPYGIRVGRGSVAASTRAMSR
jgi:hypothetical protein